MEPHHLYSDHRETRTEGKVTTIYSPVHGEPTQGIRMVKQATESSLRKEGPSKLYRRSFDFNMLNSSVDLIPTGYRSHSDSELNCCKQIDVETSMTAEFLDLPKSLSGRSSPSLLHKLDLSSLGLKVNSPSQPKKHHLRNTGHNLPLTAFELPKIEFSNVEIEPGAVDSGHDVGVDTESDDYLSRGSLWMSLEPQSHALLSPRSSNGSICSFRSSNADSAIEMLTPDEDISEASVSEMSGSADSRFWENQHRLKSHEGLWDSGSFGAIDSVNNQLTCAAGNLNESSSCSQENTTSHVSSTSSTTAEDQTPGSIMKQRLSRTPSVVISDYSSEITQEDQGSQTVDLDNSELKCSGYLGDKFQQFQRSLSSSSISSNESSSFSIPSDSSLEVEECSDLPVVIKRKGSGRRRCPVERGHGCYHGGLV